MNAGLRAEAEAWLAQDPDQGTRAELRALLDADDGAAVADRFAGRLTFGTAGLRGPMRAGPNAMNRAVVRRAAAGLAGYLRTLRTVPLRGQPAGTGGLVVVGYDARHHSAEFAHDSAAVLAGAGFAVRVLPRPLPTPVLAYAVRHLGAVAGVMVTASHNPPADNGYKVYLADGAQIAPPADAGIEAEIARVGPLATVALSDAYDTVDESTVESYLDAVAAVPRTPHRELDIVYTAMHGVGTAVLRSALHRAGFAPPVVVPEQSEPDPDFPTVAFPNPEEPGAMDLGLALARATGADLLITNDPDADRCAVGVPSAVDGTWRMLTGDEVGVLIGDHLLRTGSTGPFATTIVSSTWLGALCAARGVVCTETLTGFKWIVRAADDLAFGYEEALGYAVAPDLVRDKDGISAALLVADLAASLRAAGRTLTDRLDELAAEFDLHATGQLSIRVTNLAEITGMMTRLRAAPPARLLDRPVTAVEDLLPAADVLRLTADGCRVVVRPSGTEPKLKAYLEVVRPPVATRPATVMAAERRAAAEQLARLRAEVQQALSPR